MDNDKMEKFLEQLCQLQDQWLEIKEMLTRKQNTLLHVIYLWQHYLKLLNELQSWISTTETQNAIVKRLSIVTLDEINDDILCFENIFDQQMDIENKYQELNSALTPLLPYLTTEVVEIIHGEREETKKRVDNLWNTLQQKKVYLLMLKEKWNKLQTKIIQFEQLIEPIRALTEEDILKSYDDLSDQLQKHKSCKVKMEDVDNALDCLEVSVNELNEKFASSELLQIRNQMTNYRQTIKTLNYHLINRINTIEKNLQEWSRFHINYSEFLLWILEMEQNVSLRGDQCLEEVCQKLEEEYKLLIEQKTEEYNSIVALGEKLIAAGGEKSIGIQNDLEELHIAWCKLNGLRTRRLNKFQDLLKEMRQLQQKMGELNEWLEQKEQQLFASVVYENFTHDEIIKQMEKMEEHEEDIETHYRLLRSIISMCEMLMQDNDAIVNRVERDAIQRSVESYKRRWKEIGTIPSELKSQIEEVWNQWKKIMIDLDEIESLLLDYEKETESPRTCSALYTREEICEELKKYESLYQSVNSLAELLNTTNNEYEELAIKGGLDTSNTLQNRINDANCRWKKFTKNLETMICRLSYTLQVWEEFQISTERLLLWLTELDLHLTEIEYFPERYHILQTHLKEFEEHKEELNAADKLAVYLQQRSESSDSVRAEEAMEEIHKYWDRLFTRVLNSQQNITNEDETDKDLQQEKLKDDSVQKEEKSLTAAPPIVLTEFSEPTTSLNSHFDSTTKPGDDLEEKQNTLLEELKIALKETEEHLGITEEVIRSQTPIGFETESIPYNYSRLLATCRSNVDILKHFNELIECEEEGLSQATVPHYKQAQGIISRWEILEAKTIEKEKRLNRAHQQWQQYMEDLTSTEQWIETAEDRQSSWLVISKDMSKLEVMIQNHREFLMELIKHKPTILSLNMLTQKFISSSSHKDKSEELQSRMKILNKRWESMCQSSTIWQNELQKALLQCPEFHDTLEELINWLEASDERINHMTSTTDTSDHNVITIQYNKYLELKQELERCKSKLKAFEQTTNNLFIPPPVTTSLRTDVETGSGEIQEQLESVNERLQFLMNKCDTEVQRLQNLISENDGKTVAGHLNGTMRTQDANKIDREDNLERTRITRCYRYLSRVARAALPIQGLLLLLLGIASLVPISEDDYSCILSNNFARSFDPMLRYPDGPPPM